MKKIFTLLLILTVSTFFVVKSHAAAHDNFFTSITPNEEVTPTPNDINVDLSDISSEDWDEFLIFKQKIYDALLNRFFEPNTRRLANSIQDFRVLTDINSEHLMVSKSFEALLSNAYFNTTSETIEGLNPEFKISRLLQEISLILNFTPDQNSMAAVRSLLSDALTAGLSGQCKLILKS